MSYTSCHLYLFYKHHMLSVNCIATTTDFTPDTFNTSYGWWNPGLGWRPRKTSQMGLYNWEAFLIIIIFLIKYWKISIWKSKRFGLSQCYWLVARETWHLPAQNPEREPPAQTEALTARLSAPRDQVLLFSHLLYHKFLQAEDIW